MVKKTFLKVGPINRMTALCAVLAALLASVAVLVVAAGPSEAAFPGGNGKIALHRSGDIWSMNADGTGATRLTTNYNAESNPAVSPDGSRIAYEFFRGIWVMNADGTGQRMLTDGSTATDEDPAWSPDGTRIAFSRNGADIWVMNADGSDPRNLTNTTSTNDDEVEPAWSPDGTRIAYTRIGCEPERRGAHCVFAMNADGSGQTHLTDLPGANFNLSWSVDSKKLAFGNAPDLGVQSDVWSMNADGSNETNLVQDPSDNGGPAYAPAGNKFAFVGKCNGSQADIYLMTKSPDGQTAGLVHLTTSHADDFSPGISPDGKRLAFVSNRDGMRATDGANQTNLTKNPALDFLPAWQPLP